MKLIRILSYLITDRKRFWLCSRFYPMYFFAMFCANVKLGKYMHSKLPQKAKLRLALAHAKMIEETIIFKLKYDVKVKK